MKFKETINKERLILVLLILFIIAFGIYWTLSRSSIIKPLPLTVPDTGTISISEDGTLIGTIWEDQGPPTADYVGGMYISITSSDGDKIYFSEIRQKFKPHIMTTTNKISFSPDNRYATFVLNEYSDNSIASIYLIDIQNGTMTNLADKALFGKRAMAIGTSPSPGPIWIDNKTILFENYTREKGEFIVELSVEKSAEARIFMKDIPFAYHPSLSPDRSRLAFVKTEKAGKVNLQVLDLKSEKIITTDVHFNSISEISWSPDNKFITFSYTTDSPEASGLLNISAVDVVTGAIIPIGKGEYLTHPQWLDINHLVLSYWKPTPSNGNNIHTFSKVKIFNTTSGYFSNNCLNPIDNRYTVLPQTQKIIFAHERKLYEFDTRRALTPTLIEKIRSFVGFGVNSLISYGSKCLDDGISQSVATNTTNTNVSHKTYTNNNFGISFSYPSDWEFLEASGAGYMNLALGNGTDGIEIQMMGISGDEFNESTFRTTLEQTVKNGATFDKFEKISIGGKDFYRVLIKQGWQELSYSYYGHEPVSSKAMPKLGSFIPIFTFVSYGKEDPNPTQAVLEKILETFSVETPN